MLEYREFFKEDAMANGYTCANCGWQEVEHWGFIRYSEEEVAERSLVKEGYAFPLLGGEGVSCPGYTLSEEEKKAEREEERERKDFHARFSINNKLA